MYSEQTASNSISLGRSSVRPPGLRAPGILQGYTADGL